MLKRSLAYLISPHGFGHAARACAVMNALYARDATLRFEIFTRVPRWFFAQSLHAPFTYHACLTDIGLAQDNALNENLPQTLKRLREFFPFDPPLIATLSAQVTRLKCRAVLCDIAPLGIVVARAAGLPSILIENFTWDWIYAGYGDARLAKYSAYLRGIFRAADYHIQTEPICAPRACDVATRPVAREPRAAPRATRARLGISPRARVVLITMGGTPSAPAHAWLERLTQRAGVHFVIAGNYRRVERRDNVILVPPRSEFYHPDLAHASDAIIGKAGYSTVAEAYRAGVPFGYLAREKFREAKTMARFIETHVGGFEIAAADFASGDWLTRVEELLALPRRVCREPNGAEQIAEFLLTA